LSYTMVTPESKEILKHDKMIVWIAINPVRRGPEAVGEYMQDCYIGGCRRDQVDRRRGGLEFGEKREIGRGSFKMERYQHRT